MQLKEEHRWQLRGSCYLLVYYNHYKLQSKSCMKPQCPKMTQLYHLDNRSYSTIRSLTYSTYIMKIGEWLPLWDFFDTFSQKLTCAAHQNSHQFLKKLNTNHWIRSSSPVTNPSVILTNINLT